MNPPEPVQPPPQRKAGPAKVENPTVENKVPRMEKEETATLPKPSQPPVQVARQEPVPNPVPLPGVYETGKASFYADKFQSRLTASGVPFDQNASTAAHKELPFGTKVKVTNTQNKKSVIVTINDRGPFIQGRIIDLSRSAFSRIATPRKGIVDVQLHLID